MRAADAGLEIGGDLRHPRQDFLVPARLRSRTLDQVPHDHALRLVEVDVVGLGPVPQRGLQDPESGQPVGHDLGEHFLGQVPGLGQGQVERVVGAGELAQRLVPDGSQRAATLPGDLVDGPFRPVADPLGPHLADQLLAGQPLQRSVDRPDLDVGPLLGAIRLGLLPDLVPVQRPARGQRAQDEQPDGRHAITLTQVIACGQVLPGGSGVSAGRA